MRPDAHSYYAVGFEQAGPWFVGNLFPDPMNVAEWAAGHRMVSAASGSPHPGRWTTEHVPHADEIMECLSFSHPCEDVVFMKSAQVGGTEIGINLIGAAICQEPCPILVVLPTLDEGAKYNRVKLQPAIDATPSLANRVADVKSRSSDGSTAGFKRFRGDKGFLVVTGANSSTGLQMISARVIVFEEVSEYPFDAGNRGDPVLQALARSKAWAESRPKRFYNSTPGIKGSCRITARYEASDQRRRYVPCPHCGDFHLLRIEAMGWSDADRTRAHFVCPSCGSIIEEHAKRALLAAAKWIKTFPGTELDPAPPAIIPAQEIERWQARMPGRRQPGFAIWQAYSNFVSWAKTLAEIEDAKGDPLAEKTMTQQTLGEAYEVTGDAPDFEALYERRIDYPRHRVPPGGLFVTAAADVQGDRIQVSSYAWGVGYTGWLIDRATFYGDPSEGAVWGELLKYLDRRYDDQFGAARPISLFGIDTGYATPNAYEFVRRVGQPNRVFALDGRDGWELPALGPARKVDVDFSGRRTGRVELRPVGTYPMKSAIYRGIEHALAGPDATGTYGVGVLHFCAELADVEFCKQITAEFLAEIPRKDGLVEHRWQKLSGRANEELDIAVYARALAWHYWTNLTPEDQRFLVAQDASRPPDQQADLSVLWTPGLAPPGRAPEEPMVIDLDVAAANAVRPVPAVAPNDDEDWLGSVADDWLGSA